MSDLTQLFVFRLVITSTIGISRTLPIYTHTLIYTSYHNKSWEKTVTDLALTLMHIENTRVSFDRIKTHKTAISNKKYLTMRECFLKINVKGTYQSDHKSPFEISSKGPRLDIINEKIIIWVALREFTTKTPPHRLHLKIRLQITPGIRVPAHRLYIQRWKLVDCISYQDVLIWRSDGLNPYIE